MKYPSLTIGTKQAEIPLIQGGMGVGISLGGLAGAVAKEGGVGIISSAQIGFREPDFEGGKTKINGQWMPTDTEAANVRAIGKELEKARKIAPDGIIGFNIMVALKEYAVHVKTAVKAGADLIISGAGLPTDLPKYVEGSKTAIAPIVSTDKSAKVILKYWDRKYKRVPDLVVIEGPKAGGHLGFTKEQLQDYQEPLEGQKRYDREVEAILKTVAGYEQKYGKKIPVALAGGISDAQEVRHAFSLGADAVQAASRFVTTRECDADIRYKEAYIRARKEDIVLVKSPVGMPGRAILNPFIKRVMLGEKIPHTPCHHCLAKCNPAEIPYCITDRLICAAKGDIDEALLFCGADAWKAKRIESVKEVIDSLMR